MVTGSQLIKNQTLGRGELATVTYLGDESWDQEDFRLQYSPCRSSLSHFLQIPVGNTPIDAVSISCLRIFFLFVNSFFGLHAQS